MNYDVWPERPYQDREAANDEYVAFWEDKGP
jgi:hypothetical protein